MLVMFSPIFVADTKIISRYDFITPLKKCVIALDVVYAASETMLISIMKKMIFSDWITVQK